MKTKKMTNFSIDENILSDFKNIAKTTALNMSQFIENAMKEYILKHTNEAMREDKK